MTTSTGKRAHAIKPVWKTDAFWFVGLPTSLVAFVFVLAMIAQALG